MITTTTMAAMGAAMMAAAVVTGIPVAQPQNQDDAELSETLKTGQDADLRMTLPVGIDGQGPFDFLLDTGSQSTVVSTSLASSLALPPGPTVRIIGMAGVSQAGTARIGTIDIGRRTVESLVVPLLDQEDIGAPGILGTDSLQDQRVLFDFTQNTITVGNARELGGNDGFEIVVRARQRAGRLIMTNGHLDGVRVRVVVDTGSTTTIGNRALQRALRHKETDAITLLSATGHELAGDARVAGRLTIDNLIVNGTFIAYADSPAFEELDLVDKPAIFLGMRELRGLKRLAIDFSQDRVLFDVPVMKPGALLRH